MLAIDRVVTVLELERGQTRDYGPTIRKSLVHLRYNDGTKPTDQDMHEIAIQECGMRRDPEGRLVPLPLKRDGLNSFISKLDVIETGTALIVVETPWCD